MKIELRDGGLGFFRYWVFLFRPSPRPKVMSKPNCDHGLLTDILTSHSEADFGRRFFAYHVRKWDDCEFVQWIDAPLPTSYCCNHYDRKLKNEKEKYEKELLSLKLKYKTLECEILNLKLEKANVWAVLQGAMLAGAALAAVVGFCSNRVV